MGLDGYILTAFLFGLPANEIVLPILIMCYTSQGSLIHIDNLTNLGNILIQNGWTLITAINVMIFSLIHFPCSTTLLTIKKESNSWKWTAIAFVLPLLCGIIICIFTNSIYRIFI